ncbi:MAG: hypothetical protein JSV99_02235 [Planctomycetota bacterium]|nr:MAG: hypothetical protein JSV99_02235 [Planctomycetota bacterium]
MKKRSKKMGWVVLVWLFLAISCQAGIIYVDGGAGGSNNGSSWADAYNYLQDALAYANANGEVNEVRVAEGIYTPDTKTSNPAGSGNRSATFQLMNGVALRGGYAGFGEPEPNARHFEVYETVLSGDLNGNDVEVDPCGLGSEPTRADNSYHVVTGDWTGATGVLDGFTVAGGNANVAPDHTGGGMHNDYGGPTISNCTFCGNFSYSGGAMWNYYSNPSVTDCTFIGNSAEGVGSGGGGIRNVFGDSTVSRCTFIGNWTESRGGGLENYQSIATISNCTFKDNRSKDDAGGLSNVVSSNAFVVNCIFIGNSAAGNGGAMFNAFESNPLVVNCTFSDNAAIRNGGGIKNVATSGSTVKNCILWNNSDTSGLTESSQINNSSDSTAMVNYSCIQGWTGALGGVGNIGDDPCFVEAGYWDANGLWVGGDYHLQSGSPCINAGDSNYNPGPDVKDIDGEPRVMGGRVDIGADEAGLYLDFTINNLWMYQNLPGASGSNLTVGASITYDPNVNSSYSYEWEIIMPGDVSLAPTTVDGGGAGDGYWTFAARGCDEAGGLSDSGQAFTVRVTVTGDDYGNTGQAEAEFGIALLGDINNDGVVNVADRSIANAFWRTGSAGPYTLRDCDLSCDGVVNVADRSIANAIWRGTLGQNSVSEPCPLR